MNIGKTLYVTDRQTWRAWLADNFDKEKEIWLIYPKKATGNPAYSTMMRLKRRYVLAGLTVQPNELMITGMLNVSLPATPRAHIQKRTRCD
jgi:hypothetical protein